MEFADKNVIRSIRISKGRTIELVVGYRCQGGYRTEPRGVNTAFTCVDGEWSNAEFKCVDDLAG